MKFLQITPEIVLRKKSIEWVQKLNANGQVVIITKSGLRTRVNKCQMTKEACLEFWGVYFENVSDDTDEVAP